MSERYAKRGMSIRILIGPNYGDDSNDHRVIQQGIDLYNNYFKWSIKTMKMKPIIITIIILLTITVAVSSILYVIVTTIWGKKMNSSTIIKNFKNNEKLFEEVVKELSEEECIYIDKDGEMISISIHEHIEDKVNVIRVKKDDFYKYEKSIELMKKLKLVHISKEQENVSFLFNSMIKLGQYVVKMNDEDRYRWGNDIRNIKEIKNNWYYVEIK